MPTAMQYQILIIHYSLEIYVDIYNSQLRYGFRYLVYLVSPLLLERLTSISILLYQFEGQAYVYIHNHEVSSKAVQSCTKLYKAVQSRGSVL
jgi:hypothetical protein